MRIKMALDFMSLAKKNVCFISTARLHIVYPMLFKLSNSRSGRNTHCGVLEFVADEGKIYLPYWVSGHSVVSYQPHIHVPLKTQLTLSPTTHGLYSKT